MWISANGTRNKVLWENRYIKNLACKCGPVVPSVTRRKAHRKEIMESLHNRVDVKNRVRFGQLLDPQQRKMKIPKNCVKCEWKIKLRAILCPVCAGRTAPEAEMESQTAGHRGIRFINDRESTISTSRRSAAAKLESINLDRKVVIEKKRKKS
jgi:hypothetical protein